MTTRDETHLGQTIARLRIAKGFTQEEVAKAVGKSAQMGGKWERGENTPAPETRLALAGLFGVDPSELGYTAPATAGSSVLDEQIRHDIAWTRTQVELMYREVVALREHFSIPAPSVMGATRQP